MISTTQHNHDIDNTTQDKTVKNYPMWSSCILGVSWVYHVCIMGVSWVYRVYSGCIVGVSWVCRVCIMDLACVYRVCVVCVSWVYHGCIQSMTLNASINLQTHLIQTFRDWTHASRTIK